MLDKSIPYKHIYMIRDARKGTADPALPDGYFLRMFRDGDRAHWAAIETSVGEFADIEKALAYFDRSYAPFADELPKRCVFVCDADGTPVATATAWWGEADGQRLALVHWVSVRPEHQGKGLGRAVMQRVLQLFDTVEPELPILLHTQTWSHIAVRLYQSLGFRPLRDISAASPENDFDGALEVLAGVMSAAELQRFAEAAVYAAAVLK